MDMLKKLNLTKKGIFLDNQCTSFPLHRLDSSYYRLFQDKRPLMMLTVPLLQLFLEIICLLLMGMLLEGMLALPLRIAAKGVDQPAYLLMWF
jgi:hypothetical protein